MRSFSSTRNLKTTSALTRISRPSTYRKKPEHRIPSDGVSPTGSRSPLGTLNNGPQDQKFIINSLLIKTPFQPRNTTIRSLQDHLLSHLQLSSLNKTPSRGLISTNQSFLRVSAQMLPHSSQRTSKRSIPLIRRLCLLKLQSLSHLCTAGDTPHHLGQCNLLHCFHHRSHRPSKATTLPSQSKCRINTLTHHESAATAWAVLISPKAFTLILSRCLSVTTRLGLIPSSLFQHLGRQ